MDAVSSTRCQKSVELVRASLGERTFVRSSTGGPSARDGVLTGLLLLSVCPYVPCLLPVADAKRNSSDCSQRRERQQHLVWKPGQGHVQRHAPRRLETVSVGELPQSDRGCQEVGGKEEYGEIGEQRDQDRRLDLKHHDESADGVYAQRGLDDWEGQRVGGQQALSSALHALPIALSKCLQETLAPARPLANELSNRRRSFFSRHVAVVVNDACRYAGAAQTNSDVGVLRKVVLIPASDHLKDAASEEDSVSPQRNRAEARKEMEGALEPEEVLQNVEGRVPPVAEVHELNAGLDHCDGVLEHHSIDDVEYVGVDVVLGIEDGDHVFGRVAKSDVERMRLVDRAVVEDDHIDAPPVLPSKFLDLLLSLADRAGVVGRADDEHLKQVRLIVGAHDPGDGRLNDLLFVTGRQHHGEREAWLQKALGRPCPFVDVGLVPGIDHQIQRVAALDCEQK